VIAQSGSWHQARTLVRGSEWHPGEPRFRLMQYVMVPNAYVRVQKSAGRTPAEIMMMLVAVERKLHPVKHRRSSGCGGGAWSVVRFRADLEQPETEV